MVFAGVDIGSVACKSLIWDGVRVLGTALAPTGNRPKRTAETVLDQALGAGGRVRGDLARTVATGYGRRLVEFGDATLTEIAACGLGARFLGSARGPVRTLIDLGGQDIKVIAVDERGAVSDFVMNDKCAAGTGRFLEVMAQALEVTLADLGDLAARSTVRVALNATCTVFAESEVISLLAQDTRKEDIIAALHRAIADRIEAMAHKLGVRPIVAFTGGGARNGGLRAALEAKLGVALEVPEHPQFVNALGAAMAAAGREGEGAARSGEGSDASA
jgi:(R)-2-hydroxyacyl-CoA dehydratese activating ATPase